MISISVIIPVYNAAPFLREAVTSALQQPETGEVVLIEDGSTDRSLEVCETLVKEDSRIRLYQHPARDNQGAGASRNLGILKAFHEVISFLDGDDYYLPGRFTKAASILEKDVSVDAVYEIVGTHFESEQTRHRWIHELGRSEISGPRKPIHCGPDYGKDGIGPYVHTNGWTIRKRLFEKTGLFNPDLRLHQDADLFTRFQIAGNLEPGSLDKPVARYRIHESNRITQKRSPEKIYLAMAACRRSTWNWALSNGYSRASRIILDDFFGSEHETAKQLGTTNQKLLYLLLRTHPELLRSFNFLRSLSKYLFNCSRISLGKLRRILGKPQSS